jgi:hypothetical protein
MVAMKKPMKSLVLVAVIGAGVSSAGVALAGVQGGVAPTGSMNVEPSTVEPGDTYIISNDPGSPCMLGQVSGDTGGVRPGAWFVEPDEEGNWSVPIEVPANGPPDAMGNPTPFPAGEYEQHAFCEAPDEVEATGAAAAAQQAEFTYAPETVTVVAAQEEEPPAPPAPPAAEPAAEEPTFTG